MSFDRDDVEILSVYAVRYALGRRSYAVADVIRVTTRQIGRLSDGALSSIDRDVTEHLAKARSNPSLQEWGLRDRWLGLHAAVRWEILTRRWKRRLGRAERAG